MGIPTTQLDIVPMKELVGAISAVFASFQPNEVFVPHWGDVHSDHQAVFKPQVLELKGLEQGVVGLGAGHGVFSSAPL